MLFLYNKLETMELNPLHHQKYVRYNDPEEIENLDRPVWDSSYGITPSGATGRHLYNTLIPERYPCFRKQEPGTHYVSGFDKEELPDHSSRFGYDRCPNGYCLGHFPGKYIEPPGCCEETLPPGMAPERFYNEFYTNPNTIASQAIVDYDFTMHNGMRMPSLYHYKGEPKDRL